MFFENTFRVIGVFCQISLKVHFTLSIAQLQVSIFRSFTTYLQEFKLNPAAKNFSPSYTKRLSPAPTAMPDIGNIAYIPSNNPMLPVPEAFYPELVNNRYLPQTSPSSKFVPYGNLTAGNALGVPFPQHVSIIFSILSLLLFLFGHIMSKGTYQVVVESSILFQH